MGMRVLIVSPVPSHPPYQGNSARIRTIGQLLQSADIIVHFLYYQMEGLTSAQLADMRDSWDFVHLVPCRPRNMAPTGAGSFALDDWADPLTSEIAVKLHRRFRFQAVIVNYVWCSAVLQAFDDDVLKVLDTHDVFGGRDRKFSAAGLSPEWYYTTEQEEARGLARAHIVLAIQDEEAAYFRRLGHPNVRVLGHLMGQRFRRVRLAERDSLAVGYLASGNPINASSFERLRGVLDRQPRRRSSLRFILAGSICDRLRDADPFVVLGRVDQPEDFYDEMDIVINPMAMGTGLKIKSVEAIFGGLPLLATAAAMTGLPTKHRLHAISQPEALADCLAREHFSAALLAELAAASRACATAYASEVRSSVAGLLQTILGMKRGPAIKLSDRGVAQQHVAA
jgi:hypothetical protein